MESDRIKNYKLNNLFVQTNIDTIRKSADKSAICFVVANQEVAGFFDNHWDAMDCMGVNPGSVLNEL